MRAEETDIYLGILAESSAKEDRPVIIVEFAVTGFAKSVGICEVTGSASIAAIVVKLNPDDVELGTRDHIAHVVFGQRALWGTCNEILLC